MAYGKDDFIDFSDLDLNELLGEFTCSELEDTDDDCENVKAKAKTVSDKIYKCSDCDKTYKSISGLRGHLRTKHGISKAAVSDYREGKKTTKDKQPFHIDESDFRIFFATAFSQTLSDIENNSLRKKSKGAGKMIVDMAEYMSLNENINKEILTKLCPYYYKVFQSASSTVGNTNEALYSSFYQMTDNLTLNTEIRSVLQPLYSSNIRPFIGVLLHSLMRSLIKNQSQLYQKETDENVKPLTDNEQMVIFYISGYIINSLSRKCVKKLPKSEKLKSLNEAMQQSLKNERDSEKKFVTKYAQWTQKTTRGGLKVPSDNFFLLIRESEMCCREEVSEKNLTKDSLDKVILCEKIMDRFMVKHYADRLFTGAFASFILESVVNVFLTVRGHAWARKRKNEEQSKGKTSKKALRKSLMEYTKE